jgi:DNA-binding transcriptional MerR regulator
LTFIRHCRSLDMTLDEIRALLRFKDAPAADCGDVNSLLDEHIGHVAHRINRRTASADFSTDRPDCTAVTADWIVDAD